MAFKAAWIPGTPCTIAALAARSGERPVHFQHTNRIYVGFLAAEPLAGGEDLWYTATVYGTSTRTRFLGSVVVTPLTFAGLTPLD